MYYVVCAVACVSAGGIGHGSSDVNDTPGSNPRLPQMVYTYAKPNVSTIPLCSIQTAFQQKSLPVP